MQENRRLLLDRFARELFELEPGSVLDLGCGSGALLDRCRARGVRAIGSDVPGESLAAARSAGHAVVAGVATRLPFPDGAFDLVALRHVVHHLERPGPALREAWRVARRGLVVAEPWYDPREPAHEAGTRFDRWLRGHHRRGGMFHADDFDEAALRALLPADGAGVRVARFHPGRAYEPGDVERLARAALGEWATAQDERELGELVELASRGALPLAGTLVLVAPKRD